MKKIFKSILGAGVAVVGLGVLSACTAEKFDVLDPNGVPDAANIDVTVTVDPETNEYCLTLNNAQGCYPVWNIHLSDTKTEISTQNGKRGIITTKGEYPVEVRVGNRNGVSTGSKTVNIVIDHTMVDFGPYIQRLTAGDTKTWMIARDEAGHLGCGESGTDGLGWWSAQPNDKAAWGVYDNRMIFGKTEAADGGAYTYDPGASGTIYVNTGITDLPPYSASNTNDGNDYCAPAEKQETTFSLVSENDKLYLVLPQGTLMGYLPNVEAYNAPKFEIQSISASMVDLVIDNGAIAWHYKLGLEGEAPFMGFKYDSEFNLWKNATVEPVAGYYAPGWAQIADAEVTIDGDSYIVDLPQATTDQWQAQVPLLTDIALSADKHYDFSCIITTTADHPGITVKFTDATSDDNFLFVERPAVKAGEEYVLWMSDLPGIDAAQMKMFFDFGGNAENSKVTISKIVIKDHANDDGTVLPVIPDEPDVPEAPVTWCDPSSELNLWNAAQSTMEFYYAPGWNQIADPGFTINGSTYEIELPEATFETWQAQVKYHTLMGTSADKNYDFRITFESSTDHGNICVKLTQDGDDGNFYMEQKVGVTAYEEQTFKWVNMPGKDIEKLMLVLDFGGNAADTKVTVKDIIFQEHAE